MPNLTSIDVTSGIPTSGTGTVSTIDALMADGGQSTIGAQADAAASAGGVGTISAKLRLMTTQLNTLHTDLAGTITVASHAVTNAGTFAVQAAQSGTWTVQPGNTANTTAWKVDGSAVTQPISVASIPSHAVTNAGTFAVQSAAAGDVASGSTDSGNPIKTGGQARTTNPTAVTDGQRVNAIFDKLGKQITVGAVRILKGVTQTQISNSTSETTIVAAIASTFCDLYGLILANTGATTTKVTIKDATSGTTRAIIEVPTLETRGFMLPVDSAIPQATVNNNWTATCASATTAMEVTALWVQNL